MTMMLILLACSTQPADPSPTVEGAAAEPAEPEAALVVSGTIEAPEDVPEAQAVFVSIPSSMPGPPLVAKRLPPGPFPLEFTLTEADQPMIKGDIPTSFTLNVSLSTSGNAMSGSGDVMKASTEATRGATGVRLTLAPTVAGGEDGAEAENAAEREATPDAE